MGRSQRGNNNAYCQDNEISWLDWQRSVEQEDLLRFTKYVIEMRQQQPVLKRRRFFQGEALARAPSRTSPGSRRTAARCRKRFGRAMPARWASGWTGRRSTRPTHRATHCRRHPLSPVQFPRRTRALRAARPGTSQRWERLLDTADSRWARRVMCDATQYELAARSVVVFRLADADGKRRCGVSTPLPLAAGGTGPLRFFWFRPRLFQPFGCGEALAQESLLSDELLHHLMAVGHVDVLVGVPTLNNAATIRPIVKAVNQAFSRYLPARSHGPHQLGRGFQRRHAKPGAKRLGR